MQVPESNDCENNRPQRAVCMCGLLEYRADVIPLFPKQDINLLTSYSIDDTKAAYSYASQLFSNISKTINTDKITKVGQIISLDRVSPVFTQLDKCMFAQETSSGSRWDDPFVKLACYVALYFGKHRDDLIASVLDTALVNWDKRKLASIAALVERRNSQFRFTACFVECLVLLSKV